MRHRVGVTPLFCLMTLAALSSYAESRSQTVQVLVIIPERPSPSIATDTDGADSPQQTNGTITSTLVEATPVVASEPVTPRDKLQTMGTVSVSFEDGRTLALLYTLYRL